jgi:hypothetical protein
MPSQKDVEGANLPGGYTLRTGAINENLLGLQSNSVLTNSRLYNEKIM